MCQGLLPSSSAPFCVSQGSLCWSEEAGTFLRRTLDTCSALLESIRLTLSRKTVCGSRFRCILCKRYSASTIRHREWVFHKQVSRALSMSTNSRRQQGSLASILSKPPLLASCSLSVLIAPPVPHTRSCFRMSLLAPSHLS